MNRLLLLFIFPLLLTAQTPYKKIRVLFIGNSYTYVNNLPLLVRDLALAKGDTLVYDSYAIGGYSFGNHFTDANSKAKIALGTWDYVVLQAQSQEPSFPPSQVNAQTLPYARKLDSLVKHYNPCALTVFYETWGRKNGDAPNCAFYPPLCTYSGMQGRLRDSYILFADTCHALLAPVGEAWKLARATNTAIEFYQPDESHPALEGSYLAAAVFYETLFQKSVLTSTYTAGLASQTVSLLNQIAHQLVNDSAAITNSPKYITKGSFTVTAQGAGAFQFQSATPAVQHFWSFGDATTSTSVNTTHTYTASGNYTVSLVIRNSQGCKLDSVSSMVTVTIATSTTGLKENTLEHISLYPNPAKEILTIKADIVFYQKNTKIEITNLMGLVIFVSDFTEALTISSLPAGLYYIKIYNSQAESNSCFIKNE
ncbi:hypothetical protein CNR22_20535 [Sphingobacteriaceae bacterium]|nr:hypothetical protein CNR22_20535 [Sphingobacteriaceae bacterium]